MKKSASAANSGTELRRQLMAQYTLDSPGQLALVETACAALDQALAADAIVAKDGMVIVGARGLARHPAVQISQQARSTFMRALRALDLED